MSVGRATSEDEPRAIAVEMDADVLQVALADGRVVLLARRIFPLLAAAPPETWSPIVLMGGGIGIHWPKIDEDLSVPALVQFAYRNEDGAVGIFRKIEREPDLEPAPVGE